MLAIPPMFSTARVSLCRGTGLREKRGRVARLVRKPQGRGCEVADGKNPRPFRQQRQIGKLYAVTVFRRVSDGLPVWQPRAVMSDGAGFDCTAVRRRFARTGG